MNEHSSRSHAIFIVTVECCAVRLSLGIPLSTVFITEIIFQHSQVGPDGTEHIRMGKLNLVDLAGSERQSKTGSTVSAWKELCLPIIY